MSASPVAIVRGLARRLFYLELDEPVDRVVTVRHAETAPDDVLTALAGAIPAGAVFESPELKYRVGTVAKYGLLDLTYSTGVRRPPLGALEGLRWLRELSFLKGEPTEEGVSFLEDMIEEVQAGKVSLKVFLETEFDLGWADRRRCRVEGMPSGFWPRPFVVVDACLSNSEAVWVNKHLYL